MDNTLERLRARARKYILAESFNVTNELSESAALVSALLAEVEQLASGLEELLDVAERIRGGDTNLDPEQWYAARDFARLILKRVKGSELWPGAGADERDFSAETP